MSTQGSAFAGSPLAPRSLEFSPQRCELAPDHPARQDIALYLAAREYSFPDARSTADVRTDLARALGVSVRDAPPEEWVADQVGALAQALRAREAALRQGPASGAGGNAALPPGGFLSPGGI